MPDEIDQKYILAINREEAVEQLMNEYGEELKRLVYTYVKDYAAADDLIQEVFFTIFQKLDTFAGRSSLKTWVYTIAINKCKDYLRSWHFRKITYSNTILDFVGTSKGSDRKVMEKYQRDEIASHILKLPIKYREVIILFYYKDFSISDISSLLQMSEGSVKVRLHRGREKLKKAMERGDLNG